MRVKYNHTTALMLAAGGWQLAAHGWWLVVGGWRLTAGGWRLTQTGSLLLIVCEWCVEGSSSWGERITVHLENETHVEFTHSTQTVYRQCVTKRDTECRVQDTSSGLIH